LLTSALTVILNRDFAAVLALATSGFSMALLFILEPAPDVALVQVVVDILALVILVLALTRLPRQQRRKAQELTHRVRKTRQNAGRDAIVALSIGAVVTLITLSALMDRPRESLVTPYYAAEAKRSVGATDMVSSILVDFRALDTLLEIVVFGVAGMGIYSLLRFAAKKHGDKTEEDLHPLGKIAVNLRLQGIAGLKTSPFVRAPTFVALPISLLLGATHMMYGHDQPGDGFTAGVIISLAVALWFVVFGYEETRRRLPWLKATLFVGSGVLLAIVTGTVTAFITGNFLGNVMFSQGWAFLPDGFYISSSFLFEVAICLTVFGSAARMLISLGHPEVVSGD
jgi:multicomponent K+:H+ antiporter subunit A